MNITLDLRKSEDRRRQNLGPPLWHLERRSQADRRVASCTEPADNGREWVEALKSGPEPEQLTALGSQGALFA